MFLLLDLFQAVLEVAILRQDAVQVNVLVRVRFEQGGHGMVQTVHFALVGVSFLDQVFSFVQQGLSSVVVQDGK